MSDLQPQYDEADDFSAGFNSAMGTPIAENKEPPAIEPEPITAEKDEAESSGDQVQKETTENKQDGDGTAPPPQSPELFLGKYTAEQIEKLLADAATMQALQDRLRKAEGKLGEVVGKLKAVEKGVLPSDLKATATQYPDLVDALKKDMQAAEANKTAAPEQIPIEQTQAFADAQMRVLDNAQPDWRQVTSSPSFRIWMNTMLAPQEAHSLNNSRDAVEILNRVKEFKAYQSSVSAHIPTQSSAPVATASASTAKVKRRLLSNLPIANDSSPPPKPSDQDDFVSGFNAVRGARR